MSSDKMDATKTIIWQRGQKREIPKPLSHPPTGLLQRSPSAHTHRHRDIGQGRPENESRGEMKNILRAPAGSFSTWLWEWALFKPRSEVTTILLLETLQWLLTTSRGKLQSSQGLPLSLLGLCSKVPFQHGTSWSPYLIFSPHPGQSALLHDLLFSRTLTSSPLNVLPFLFIVCLFLTNIKTPEVHSLCFVLRCNPRTPKTIPGAW